MPFRNSKEKNNYGIIDEEGRACRADASRQEWKCIILFFFFWCGVDKQLLMIVFVQTDLMVTTHPEVRGETQLDDSLP